MSTIISPKYMDISGSATHDPDHESNFEMKTLYLGRSLTYLQKRRRSNMGERDMHVLFFSVPWPLTQIIFICWEQKEKCPLQPLKHRNGRAKVVAIIFLRHQPAAIHSDHIRARLGAKPP